MSFPTSNVMNNSQLLSELFGGADRYKALRCLFENPSTDFGPRELATRAAIDPGNASRWLRRWAEKGLVEKTYSRGHPRYVAGRDPQLTHLRLLLQQDSEMIRQLRERVTEAGERIIAAAVFGSIAKGTAGAESDVDVLLLTEMSQLEAQVFFKPTARAIGKPVNVMVYMADTWRRELAEGNPLVLEIATGPLIALKGEIYASA